MIIIKQPYIKYGLRGDGILYGHGYAKHIGSHIDNETIYLCNPESILPLEPGQYRFYKVVKNRPIEVKNPNWFFTGKKFIDKSLYLKR